MKHLSFFMIRRKSDGLYSTGGHYPEFKTRGKAWASQGAISNHLAQFIGKYAQPSPYKNLDDYEIVKLVLREEHSGTSELGSLVRRLTTKK